MAIIIVFSKDCKSNLLSNSFIYQSNVNPFHDKYGFDVVELKEFTTITTMGKNKNRYTEVHKMT
jgi:hypothetical protein